MSEKLNELKDIMRQNNPRTLNRDDIINIATVKGLGNSFHAFLDDLPQSREISLAKTKLEECVMWAVKGVSG